MRLCLRLPNSFMNIEGPCSVLDLLHLFLTHIMSCWRLKMLQQRGSLCRHTVPQWGNWKTSVWSKQQLSKVVVIKCRKSGYLLIAGETKMVLLKKKKNHCYHSTLNLMCWILGWTTYKSYIQFILHVLSVYVWFSTDTSAPFTCNIGMGILATLNWPWWLNCGGLFQPLVFLVMETKTQMPTHRPLFGMFVIWLLKNYIISACKMDSVCCRH